MIMNNVYFSDKGITSTEANHLANIAKEYVEGANERLNGLKFYNVYTALIGSSEKQEMSIGNLNLNFVFDDTNTIAHMNAFCAWVREAIKEKERQQGEITDTELEDWVRQKGIDYPEYPNAPVKKLEVTDKEVINSWDIDKRCKYLRLEAFAATLGKCIHPDGNYSKARKAAHKALNEPITKEGSGRDTVLYYKELNIDLKDIDEAFFKLQDNYRGFEKELNVMKAEAKETANSLTRANYEQYQKEVGAYKVEYDKVCKIREDIRNQFIIWGRNELERIAKLKIVIPESLKETYKLLASK